MFKGRVADRIEDAAGIDERHQHEPEMLIPQHRFAEIPPQFAVCVRGRAANEPIRDESAQSSVAAQTIGVAVGKRNDRRRIKGHVAELHDIGQAAGQDEASGIAQRLWNPRALTVTC